MLYVFMFECACVCGSDIPCIVGENVPTKMTISKTLIRVETFFGPCEETSLKKQTVFFWGGGGGGI